MSKKISNKNRKLLLNGKPIKFFLLLPALMSLLCCSSGKPYKENEGLKVPSQIQRAGSGSRNAIPRDKISPVKKGKDKAATDSLETTDNRIESVETAKEHGESQRPVSTARDLSPPSRILVKEPGKKKSEKEAKDIVINFDNADFYEVVGTFGKFLGINYIIDPGITGKVTIHISEKLGKKDLLPIFLKILEINDLTVIVENGLYEITPIGDAPRRLISTNLGKIARDPLPVGGPIIQIIPLKYISASEMAKLLTPFVSTKGNIVPHGETNTLLVVERWKNIEKILKIVDVVDVDVFEKLRFKLYKIENADAGGLAESLKEAFSGVLPLVKGKDFGPKFIVINHLNSVLAVSSNTGVFTTINELIKTMDIASRDVEPRIYVYSVKNGEARNLSELLNKIFNSAQGEKKIHRKKKEERKPAKKSPQRTKKPGLRTVEVTRKTLSSGSLKGEVIIVADDVRNSLLIEAIPADYRTIGELLKSLDVLPRQVLIECLIAEILLDDSTKLGIDWTYMTSDMSVGITGLSSIASGFKYSIEKVGRLTGALRALAEDGKVNILSSPSILASDNKEAKIAVSTEMPITTAEYRYTEATEPVVETAIQYRDTGVILKVTPHINERGLVTLDINQEVSEFSQNVSVGSEGSVYPSFYKRTAETTLTVQDGQTIIIGGLIKQKRERGRKGVPLLVEIPIIGALFGYTYDINKRTELMILLTPRVIISSDDVDTVTEEFRRKLGKLREELKGKRY